jgi:hypothetical protein
MPMPKLRSLYSILGELAMMSPKLVLMQGRSYFRIDDLWGDARRDWATGNAKDRSALSESIYWTTTDVHGKLLLKGVTLKGVEFVAFVEPGSDIPTAGV